MIEKELMEAIIAYQCYDDYDEDKYDFAFEREELYDEGRWTVTKEYVVKEKNSDRYFSYCYQGDACESCEGSGSGFIKSSLHEVEPFTKTVIDYKEKEQ